MIFPKKRITKALIRLGGCAGWSVPVLFANHQSHFSRVEAHITYDRKLTDKVINFWQQILKLQFPEVNGLQAVATFP